MKNLIIIGIFVVLSIFRLESALGYVTPLSVSIVPPVQFPSEDFTVTGVRLSPIYGHHRNVFGIDVGGIGNISQTSFVGTALSGIFNYNRGSTTILGLQFAGITNINIGKTDIYGLQLALGLNSNVTNTTLTGLQFAILGNHSPFTRVIGAQVSLYNRAQDVYGFQIGLVNFAKNLHGIQIGLLNFNEGGLFAVSPIINIGF